MDTYIAAIPAETPPWLPGFDAMSTMAAKTRIMSSKTVTLSMESGKDIGIPGIGGMWLVVPKDPTIDKDASDRFTIAGKMPSAGDLYIVGREYMKVAAVVFRLVGSSAGAVVVLEGLDRGT